MLIAFAFKNRDELCEILPELRDIQDNIAHAQTETPVLFLDQPKCALDEWDGGKRIRLGL